MGRSLAIGVAAAALLAIAAGIFPLAILAMISGMLAFPQRVQRPGMLGFGAGFDLLSGHTFGLGILLCAGGSAAVGRAWKIFRPSATLRVSVAWIATHAILAGLAASHIVAESADPAVAAHATWTPAGIAVSVAGSLIAFAVLLTIRRRPMYAEHFSAARF